MKISVAWLSKLVNFKVPLETIVEQLTFAGLEVDNFNSQVIEVDLTPNRGDCASMQGIAREVALANNISKQTLEAPQHEPTIDDALKITLKNPNYCPFYAARIITGIDNSKNLPAEIMARLKDCGINSVNPIVDLGNYVMLELGTPMHAFSLNKISGNIEVRLAKAKEKITLLDGSEQVLDDKTLVIADDNSPLAIAGVMGGDYSSVQNDTSAVFIESAFFTPELISGVARKYNLATDSAYRFERGVDYNLQVTALMRFSALILQHLGGKLGPITTAKDDKYLPKEKTITLRLTKITQILGLDIPETQVVKILTALGLDILENNKNEIIVKTPSFRFDLTSEIDLIEELARVVGYDKIAQVCERVEQKCLPAREEKLSVLDFKKILTARGFNEVINFSFISPKLSKLLVPENTNPIMIKNPISTDLSVMRGSLIPGLVETILYNVKRKQERLKIFEAGLKFNFGTDDKFSQIEVLAGAVYGAKELEAWQADLSKFDFFDLKGELEVLFASTNDDNYSFVKAKHDIFHPGISANIKRGDKVIGKIGALNPAMVQELGLSGSLVVFELTVDELVTKALPKYSPLSKFPRVRRDLALVVEDSLPAAQVLDAIKETTGELLAGISLFDVYQGKGVPDGSKSLAVALYLQDMTRTLIDEEVDSVVAKVLTELKTRYNATLRE